MATTFNITDITNYPDISLLFKQASFLVCEHMPAPIGCAQFTGFIEQAEQEGKIAIFHNVDFDDINLNNHEFRIPIVFSKCRFKGSFKLFSCRFIYKIFFHSVIWEKSAKFRHSLFYSGVSFLDSSFKQEASFERTKFLPTYVKFLRKEYQNVQIAFEATFNNRNMVDFLGVDFYHNVTFVNTYFGCSALFSAYNQHHTKFHGEADFSCTPEEIELLTFDPEASSLHKTTKEIELSLDTFHRLGFISVEFFSDLTFENRIFQKKTVFKDTVFFRAPKFHNAELHQDTDFRGAVFRDTSSEGAERAYRTLKLNMDKKRARREEGMFFALEQKSILNSPLRPYRMPLINHIRQAINTIITDYAFSKRERMSTPKVPVFEAAPLQYSGFSVSLTEKLVSFLYLTTSNYGQSLKRPLAILLILLLGIFPSIYYFGFPAVKLIHHSWAYAYQLSLQQLFRPFEIYAVRFRDHYDDTPLLLYLAATVQALLNVGLLTLFALAMRGRFRMY